LVIETNAHSEGFWKSIGFTPKESMQGLLFIDILPKRQAETTKDPVNRLIDKKPCSGLHF
jgi:hypothetical protein